MRGLCFSFRTGTGNVVVNGVNNRLETYISVEWYWLIFPCFMLVFTILFLLATIAKNNGQRTKAWKSLSTAVLGGLSSDAKAKLGDLTSTAFMQNGRRK